MGIKKWYEGKAGHNLYLGTGYSCIISAMLLPPFLRRNAVGAWTGLRAGLDVVTNGEFLTLVRNRTPIAQPAAGYFPRYSIRRSAL
jgi:hypothetical protein